MPSAADRSPSSTAKRFPSTAEATAAHSRNSSSLTPIEINGPRHSAHTPTNANAPAELLMTEALARTAEAASDKIPPTTGSALAMIAFVPFTAAASAPPVSAPVSEI